MEGLLLEIRVNSELEGVLSRTFPEFLRGSGRVVLPSWATLDALNSRLLRFGWEAWSRFPGLSVQFRFPKVKNRGVEVAEKWRKSRAEMLKGVFREPSYDELYTQAIRDKRALDHSKFEENRKRSGLSFRRINMRLGWYMLNKIRACVLQKGRTRFSYSWEYEIQPMPLPNFSNLYNQHTLEEANRTDLESNTVLSVSGP